MEYFMNQKNLKLKKSLILLLLIITISIFTLDCKSRSIGHVPVGYAKISSTTAQISVRPNVNAYEIGKKQLKGEATSKRILGYFELVRKVDVLSGVVEGKGIGKLDDLAKLAAYSAINDAKDVDGLYITKVERKNFSVFPFYSKEIVTVYGLPIRFKSKGPLSVKDYDWKYNFWLKRLKAKSALNKKVRSQDVGEEKEVLKAETEKKTETKKKAGR